MGERKEEKGSKGQETICLSMPGRNVIQTTIDDWAGEECKYKNIEPVGDPMVARERWNTQDGVSEH